MSKTCLFNGTKIEIIYSHLYQKYDSLDREDPEKLELKGRLRFLSQVANEDPIFDEGSSGKFDGEIAEYMNHLKLRAVWFGYKPAISSGSVTPELIYIYRDKGVAVLTLMNMWKMEIESFWGRGEHEEAEIFKRLSEGSFTTNGAEEVQGMRTIRVPDLGLADRSPHGIVKALENFLELNGIYKNLLCNRVELGANGISQKVFDTLGDSDWWKACHSGLLLYQNAVEV